ncbi:AbrB/MazE/SpoVT family DNA-binding domain-containing protein [Endozoicomonas atrinae]|uniref:AbrB/MazE/SpoVT family DNA-binding domain-containing protein n=1 Tax=Endozoicomonas atrinae TaxID=1333660 RepID=UPI003B00F4FC
MNIATATVTSKGQITIPATIRNTLNVGPGDRIQFVEVAPGRFEMLVACNDVKSLKGMVKTSHNVSIEEMNQAIERRGSES